MGVTVIDLSYRRKFCFASLTRNTITALRFPEQPPSAGKGCDVFRHRIVTWFRHQTSKLSSFQGLLCSIGILWVPVKPKPAKAALISICFRLPEAHKEARFETRSERLKRWHGDKTFLRQRVTGGRRDLKSLLFDSDLPRGSVQCRHSYSQRPKRSPKLNSLTEKLWCLC